MCPTDPRYYNCRNLDLLDVMPADARLVVEIGCAAGVQGSMYKQRNPRCRYVGIEIHAPAVELARSRLDEVLVADVERFDERQLDFRGQVDCLVYGDVLEHLVDPWGALRRHSGWLKPDGHVVASIPNVGHMAVILGLLDGKWPYADEGLLDRTHLRFFTQESVAELFSQAGLRIVELRRNVNPLRDCQRWERLLEPLARELGRDSDRFRDDTRTLRYIVHAVRAAAPWTHSTMAMPG